VTQFILLRHADPESAGLYIGRRSDPALNAEGSRAALEIAQTLASEKPSALYSSPLRRAMATIEPAGRILGMPVQILEGMAEMDFGEWEGLDWKTIDARNPGLYASWINDPWTTAPPGGETLKEMSARVISALNGILGGNGDGRVIIACHGGPVRAVLGYALGLKPQVFWNAAADYTGLCRFSLDERGGMNLLQWNVQPERRRLH
jgi:broad specificity phosphatase PhoE